MFVYLTKAQKSSIYLQTLIYLIYIRSFLIVERENKYEDVKKGLITN